MTDRPNAEIPLPGGRVTPGVVRVGDTVRRPRQASSAFVADLLTHLHRHGFTGAPRYLGSDEAGRDTMTYVDGWVPARLRPFADDQVADAGTLLRAYHDATRGCRLAEPYPVVCHNDPGPNNVVFRHGRPVAFIDFDTAAPGDPLDDLGYLAWLWCCSARPTAPPVHTQARQVRLLADSYGLDPRAALTDAILASQDRNVTFWRRRATERAATMIDWTRRERRHVAAYRHVFDDALR
ncbi:MAG TPA: phosphotransferase [Actinocatenispora sp.]